VNKWPLYQDPESDELFSSWLTRNALAHGCSPMSFAGALWPSKRVWITDIDCRELAWLEQGFEAWAVAAVRTTTVSLQTAVRRLSGNQPRAGNVRWLLSQGHRNRWCRCGMQFCPLCFSCQAPYYRYQWRLAWHTTCDRHGVQLSSRCANCHAPVQPHLLQPPMLDCGRCHRCAEPLSAHHVIQSSVPRACDFQRLADSQLNTGDRSEGWFDYAYLLISLLRYAKANQTGSSLLMLKDLGVGDHFCDETPDLPIELMEVSDRAKLLADLHPLVVTPPVQLIRMVAAYRIPASAFGRLARNTGLGSLPSALVAAAVSTNPRRSPLRSRSESVERSGIEKKWLRLQRKILSYERS